MNIPILFEDEAFLVINKPPGIVVNRAESVKECTIQDWTENDLKITLDRGGIVHRIDKETSGILLIAKTPQAFTELQRQFKERIVKKTYVALVHGKITPPEGEIRAPIGRLPWNKERFGIVPGGKDAITKYKVFQGVALRSKATPYEMIEVFPETGRTHQIRVHLKYINHPIVGDFLYAGRKTARADRTWVPRVMLHAWKISFIHPGTGKMVDFTAPIPDDMRCVTQ